MGGRPTRNQVTHSRGAVLDLAQKKGDKVAHSERYFGKQSRSFALGSDIDAAKAEAKYQNGVLELALPKKANGSSKELKVQ